MTKQHIINITAAAVAAAAFFVMERYRIWFIASGYVLVAYVGWRWFYLRYPEAAAAFLYGCVRGLFRRRR